MLGAWRARVAPFNVNYRYVKNELQYLLADAGATALIYHATFAPRVAEVLPDLPKLRVLIQIADDSGNDLVHGAVDYESIVASGSTEPPPVEPSPDDLYVLYTGGTTGMPKGVLWRQHDIFMTSFGGRNMSTGEVTGSYDEIAKRVAENPGHQDLHPAAADARRRAVGRHDRAHHRADGRIPHDTKADSTPTRSCARSSGSRSWRCRWSATRWRGRIADAIERGTADVSSLAVVANGGRAADPDRQAAPDRRQARTDRHGRRRVVGDRHPDEPHVHAGRGVDRQVQRGPGHQRRGRGPRLDPGTRP